MPVPTTHVPVWAVPGTTVIISSGTKAQGHLATLTEVYTPPNAPLQLDAEGLTFVLANKKWRDTSTASSSTLFLYPVRPKVPAQYDLDLSTGKAFQGATYYRIRSTRAFGKVRAPGDFTKGHDHVAVGELGGWVPSTHLADGTPRISGNAWLRNDAMLSDNASISDQALVMDNSHLCINARATENSMVGANARMCGNSLIKGSGSLSGFALMAGSSVLDENASMWGHAVAEGNTLITDRAQMCDNASARDNAVVKDTAWLQGTTQAIGTARITHNARLRGNATVSENAMILRTEDYLTVSLMLGCPETPTTVYRTSHGYKIHTGLGVLTLSQLTNEMRKLRQKNGTRNKIERRLFKRHHKSILAMIEATGNLWIQ